MSATLTTVRDLKSAATGSGDLMQDIVVFLLAHQDDEFGAFFAIEEAVGGGARVLCLYLTDGGYGGQETKRRDDESRNVLRRLGVAEADIHFIGTNEGYGDTFLYTRLDEALRSVELILGPLDQIRLLYIPAWEGGHRDHDAVHLIGAAYALGAGVLDAVRQFPLYRASPNIIGFALLKPLAENGPIQTSLIPWAKRFRYLRLTFLYGSQWIFWVGLFPALLHSYCSKGAQETQRLSVARLFERPHAGTLLYERYGRINHETFRTTVAPFIQAKIVEAQALPNKTEGSMARQPQLLF